MSSTKYAAVLTVETATSMAMKPHVVPTAWLTENDSVLHYPPTKLGESVIEGIIQNGPELFMPNPMWKKYAVIVKHKCQTYAEAEEFDDVANLKELKKQQAKINGQSKCEVRN